MMNFASYPLQQKKNGWSSEVDDDFDFGSEPTPSLDIEGISNVQSGQSNDDITLNSLCSSIRSKDMQNTFLNGDMPPLSLLQLQGITVGNFNMACSCHIFAALQIMIKYKIHIMAIQEHTTWNRNLSEEEINSIHRHCNNWGFFATVTKLQILILDKQLWACHQSTNSSEDGRIIVSRFAISNTQHATFVAIYGIPHHGGKKFISQIKNLRRAPHYKK
jgi:hypothetical protein